MAYKVEIEGGSNQRFTFINYDDALNFASLVVDYGTTEEYHYEDHTRISDGWRPIKVTLTRGEDD